MNNEEENCVVMFNETIAYCLKLLEFNRNSDNANFVGNL